jgi:histidinol-phosphate aminotransferase
MSKNGVVKLIRPELVNFTGYVASKSPEEVAATARFPINGVIKLDANENPYGCSPRVMEALSKYDSFNIYPDAGQRELKKLLQGYTGVDAEHIVASSGSDQMIGLIMQLFVGPGDEVINFPPTFDIFRFAVTLCNGRIVDVPRDGNYNVDIAATKKAITKKTKLIVLANPNNPTGNPTPRKNILELLDTGVPLLADEAYVEFSGETVTPLVPNYKNLMVLRTFSKWAGLASFRIGYGIFPPEIADYLMNIKMPYSVSSASTIAVRESLKDRDFLMERVKKIVAERERLYGELKKIEWLKPFPSKANFIFCHVLNGTAKQIYEGLMDRSIIIRYAGNHLLKDAIRIGVGKPEHTDMVIKAIREIGEGKA